MIKSQDVFSCSKQLYRDYQLTPKQLAVAAAMIDSESMAEISIKCGISEKTVRCHLTCVYKKFGVKNRLALFKKLTEVIEPYVNGRTI